MHRLILVLSISATLLFAQPTAADDAAVHFAAHFGVSYVLSTAIYGFTENVLMCSKTDAFIFATVTTLLVGAVYKFTEITPSDPQWPATFGRAMLYNSAGILGAGLTITVFKW
jgi:hypothetical protein